MVRKKERDCKELLGWRDGWGIEGEDAGIIGWGWRDPCMCVRVRGVGLEVVWRNTWEFVGE